MITILQRYIAKTIILSTGIAALVITGIVLMMSLLGELKFVGVGDYGVTQVLFYVFLKLPNELYQYSPLLLLLGSIIGLSILSSHRELAVMRASGVAISHIIFSVLSAAFVLILAISFLGEWIGPLLSSQAMIQKENAQNAGQAVMTAKGVWLHVENNFIHVQHVTDKQLLEGVTRYQFNNKHDLSAAYYAKSMTLKSENDWLMKDVVRTTFFNDRTKTQSYAELPLNVHLNPNLINIALVEPKQMSLPKLAKFIHYLQKNGLQSNEYQFDFWQRIFQPFSSLVMIFLAIPFVLSTLSTSTLGWRIMFGLLIGFAFFILNALLGQLCIVYQLPTLLAALFPPMLFTCFGFLLAKQMIKR